MSNKKRLIHFLVISVVTVWMSTLQAAVKPQLSQRTSPVLSDQLAYMAAHPELNAELPVIVRVKESYFRQDDKNRRYRGINRDNMLGIIHSYRGRLTRSQIQSLMESEVVEYVTLDMPLHSTKKHSGKNTSPVTRDLSDLSKHVLQTIGVDQIALGTKGKKGKKGTTIPTGKGVRIAVFDSGLSHPDIDWDSTGVMQSADFTGDVPDFDTFPTDEFGHGSAVAGLIGGDGGLSGGEIRGIAPDVRFLDVKVIGADGTGRTSQLIRAIDWVVANQKNLKIQIANLSLGHPPIESYENDPLCLAVRRMVKAGIVTIVSAGNLGKTADYPEIWGSISSPGNEPSVITVGAMNTRGTVTHKDDIAASYSSRGPTYIDGLFKPDLVAPGNALICPGAFDSFIVNQYPELVVAYGYLELSGSSMATAVVSGVAALMIDANPRLNPNLVKIALLLTAIKMPVADMLEQGNGMVNGKT